MTCGNGGTLTLENDMVRASCELPGPGRTLQGGDDMTERTCSVDGCEKPTQARGWCTGHYRRWNSRGDVRADEPLRVLPPPVERFWAQVDRGASGECWLWTGGLGTSGYGVFCTDARRIGAHRYSLNLAVACPDPALLACHHCDNPPCVNPAHLYWGTYADNVQDMLDRGRAVGGRAKKLACANGHPYTTGSQGKRSRCSVCDRANRQRKNERKRQRYQALRAYGFSPREANRLKLNSKSDALIGFRFVEPVQVTLP